MSLPDLSETEASVLRAVRSEERVDIYNLAHDLGEGPRTVQAAIQRLAEDDLVHVSGRQVRCTKTGDQWVRRHR